MRKTIITFLVGLLLLGYTQVRAQDPHFSQFNAAPLELNPALTGFYNGDYRIAANFRSQWGSFSSAYRTVSGSFEMSILKGKLKDDNLAFGAVFYNDQAGDAGFGRNNMMFSACYKKSLGYRVKHTLSAGVSFGFMQDHVNTDKLTFDNQYNGVVYDPTIPSNVLVQGSSFGFDLNAGVLYQIVPSEYSNYYFGASISHILGPKLGLLDGSSYKILPRYTAHFGAKIEVNTYLNILPSAMYQQEGEAREAMAGGYVQFVFDELNDAETAFAFGGWFRLSELTTDAAIIGARLDFQNFALGASYDVNVSSLKQVSQSRGAYEISLIYTGRFVTRGKRRLSIPCPQL
jgi:type IX secretion system PorP/SprF family membrane protein